MPNGHSMNEITQVSTNLDERSVHSSPSHALSPNSIITGVQEAEEPRSSGILNLMDMPRSMPHAAPKARPPPAYEPRSSGFLALDLAERLSNHKQASEPAGDFALPPPHQTATGMNNSSPPYARSNPDASFERRSPIIPRPIKNGLIANGVSQLPPRKRKNYAEHLALDVLADVSVASPLIH